MKKRYRHFDTQLSILHPGTYYNIAAADEMHAIILLPLNMNVDDKLRHHISILYQHVLKKQLEKLDDRKEL